MQLCHLRCGPRRHQAHQAHPAHPAHHTLRHHPWHPQRKHHAAPPGEQLQVPQVAPPNPQVLCPSPWHYQYHRQQAADCLVGCCAQPEWFQSMRAPPLELRQRCPDEWCPALPWRPLGLAHWQLSCVILPTTTAATRRCEAAEVTHSRRPSLAAGTKASPSGLRAYQYGTAVPSSQPLTCQLGARLQLRHHDLEALVHCKHLFMRRSHHPSQVFGDASDAVLSTAKGQTNQQFG